MRVLAGVLVAYGVFQAGAIWSQDVPEAVGAIETRSIEFICRALVRHQPSPDVAFAPGRAADGTEVAPADLPAEQVIDADRIAIPITVDVARRLGIDLGEGLGSEALVGVITFAAGEAYFNGRPLDAGASASIAALCGEAGLEDHSAPQ